MQWEKHTLLNDVWWGHFRSEAERSSATLYVTHILLYFPLTVPIISSLFSLMQLCLYCSDKYNQLHCHQAEIYILRHLRRSRQFISLSYMLSSEISMLSQSRKLSNVLLSKLICYTPGNCLAEQTHPVLMGLRDADVYVNATLMQDDRAGRGKPWIHSKHLLYTGTKVITYVLTVAGEKIRGSN